MSEVLGEPGSGTAVGAFTAYDLEAGVAVLAAAATCGRPVILLVSRTSFDGPTGLALVRGLLASAADAPVRACVQLDHVSDLALIDRAAKLGCGAVMADGSRLGFEANVELVAAAREMVAAAGVEVEGELGHLAGGEDVARAAVAEGLTDPASVRGYVERTGVACLAVSIGNVHGSYAAPPALDWERLAEIRRQTDVHISLHGASGLSAADLRRAIELGTTKVNVNLELRQAYLGATAEALNEAQVGYDLIELHTRQMAAVEDVAREKIELLAGTA